MAATPEELLESYKATIEQADKFLSLLHEFCDMGTAMRSVITRCLVTFHGLLSCSACFLFAYSSSGPSVCLPFHDLHVPLYP